MKVYVGIRTVSEANQRGNTRIAAIMKHRRVKEQRTRVALMLRCSLRWPRAGHLGDVALLATVTLTRIAPSALDDDNLQGALKAVRDEVAAFLGVDDRDPRVTWLYGQRKGKPREMAVEITFA